MRADRAPVLLDLRRERAGSGIGRIMSAWRPLAEADPAPIALLEGHELSDRSPWPSEPRALRARVRRADATLLHTIYPYALVPAGIPNLLTVHDTLQLDRGGARAAFFGALLRRNLRHAVGMACGSAHSRTELCARLGFPEDRTVVIPWGVEPAPAGVPDAASPYAVYVGNAKPHKHVEELVDWGAAALAQHGLRLVCVVPAADHDRLARAGVELRSGLDQAELDALVGAATLYVSLAEGEGFGLPPLEAAARGVPSVLHDAGAHREVLAGAATYCALDRDSFAAAVTAALGDREALRSRARERAAHFSWEASWAAARQAHARFA